MKNSNLPIWRQKLKSSQIKEGKSISNRWIQMANVSNNNQPRVRTVVFRGWLDNTSMLIYTDTRSEKFKDLEFNNNVEILWLFLKSKSQYRFKGKAFKIENNSNYWNCLPDRSKDTWFWPNPGEEINEENLNLSPPDKLLKPKNFTVFQLQMQSVDLLSLDKPVHKRFIWEEKNNWDCKEIYP